NRLAVCDGYTAAYNLLLKLEGIECRAVDREDWDHMWTVAVLDGVSYHIDATWGDQTGTAVEYYFAMTEEVSLARFH
ncbi:MAG: surface layer protein, partial [Oscillospiraceae bacterium]|nr:surface layer protein [Oscillospiraceae bacterium]